MQDNSVILNLQTNLR